MVSNEKELREILKEIESPPFSLKKLSGLYFKAKEKVFSNEEITRVEILAAASIFLNGYAKTYEYLSDKEIKDLTDEELENLLILCDEASMNFDYLAVFFEDDDDSRLSSIFSQEGNEEKQEEIKSTREYAIKEKAKRKVRQENGDNSENKSKTDDNVNELLNESSKKRISELQKEVDFLRNKNKPKKADRLQKKVDKINNPEKNNPEKNNPEKNNPEKNNPEKNNNLFSLNSFLIGGAIVLAMSLIFFLIFKNKDKSKK